MSDQASEPTVEQILHAELHIVHGHGHDDDVICGIQSAARAIETDIVAPLQQRAERAESERDDLRASIKEAIHDLPDKGSDAMETLRWAIGEEGRP